MSLPWAQSASERQQQFAVSIQTLIEEMAQLRASQSTAPAAPSTAQPKPVLPHLDKFTGTTQEVDAWIYSAEAKLYTDGLAIGDLEAQFHYLYSSLSPSIKIELLPFAKQPSNRSPDRLLQKIRLDYGDPSADKRAGLELLDTRQTPKETITKYLLRYENVLYRAGASTWPDDAKITILRGSLNDEWTARLRERADAPEPFQEFLEFLRRLDGNNYLGAVDAGDPMQIGATRTTRGRRGGGGSSSGAGAVTLEQRQRWKKENRCTGCGSSQHWAKECPVNKNKGKGKAAVRLQSTALEPAGDSDDNEIYEDDN